MKFKNIIFVLFLSLFISACANTATNTGPLRTKSDFVNACQAEGYTDCEYAFIYLYNMVCILSTISNHTYPERVNIKIGPEESSVTFDRYNFGNNYCGW